MLFFMLKNKLFPKGIAGLLVLILLICQTPLGGAAALPARGEEILYHDSAEQTGQVIPSRALGTASALGAVGTFIQPEQTPQTITQSQYESAVFGQYRIPNSSITSYTNNGGVYWESYLSKAFDDNIGTHWETGTPNSATFKNNVTVTFSQTYTIAQIDYQCRHDGTQPKGFPTRYKLYYSTAASGENFQVLAEGAYSGPISEMVTIYFAPTDMRRFRFEFVECHENWASMSELRFFKPMSTENELLKVFTDNTYSNLRDEYKSAAKLDEMIASAQGWNDAGKSAEILNEAKKLLNTPGFYDSMLFTALQRGNSEAEKKRTQIQIVQSSLVPTGFYVCPNETISVYLEAEKGDPMPGIVLGQIGKVNESGSNGLNWRKTYSLKPGINVITAPAKSEYFDPSAIYINNDFYPEDQNAIPKMRIVGGTRFPLYVHGKTDPTVFQMETEAYVSNLSTNEAVDFAAGRPANGKYFNIAEAGSENVLLTTSASGMARALQNDATLNKTISDTMNAWEDMYDQFAVYSGFDLTDETSFHYRPRGMFICRTFVCDPGIAAYCYMGYTAYNVSSDKTAGGFYMALVSYSSITGGEWAYYHEIGHSYEMSKMQRSETTNNLYSLYLQTYFTGTNRLTFENRWKDQVEAYHKTKISNSDVFFQLAVLYQLELVYGNDLYARASRLVRENEGGKFTGLTPIETMLTAYSLVLGVNLADHFTYYQVPFSGTALTKTGVSALPRETRKTWLVNNKLENPDASAFENQSVPQISGGGNGNSVTLTLSINERDASILCYEIFRNGVSIGISYSSTFADTTAAPGTSYTYTAKAYDCELNESGMSAGLISGAGYPTIVSLGDMIVTRSTVFNPLGYISAKDSSGVDITGSVTVKNTTVNMDQAGEYTVTLTVTAGGKTTDRTFPVQVTEKAAYLSDLPWQSATVGWGTIQKDKAISGNPLTYAEEAFNPQYKKGIGVHALSTVIYDLSGTDYTHFRSYIGADKSSYGPATSPSIVFSVYLDGSLAYTSGMMTWDSYHKYVEVELKDARELKLEVTDAGNGIGNDHGNWADAMLIKYTSSQSVLTFDDLEIGNTNPLPRENVTVFAATSGGTGAKRYTHIVTKGNKLCYLQMNTVSDSFSYHPYQAGTYMVTVTCSDETGISVTKTGQFTVS